MKKLVIGINKLAERTATYIITFEGDFDGYAKENLIEIEDFISHCEKNTILIFDFAKLNYLNSYAIGHLVAWHNTLTGLGGKIMIAGTNKNVEDIFTILNISALFKFYPGVEEAKKDL